MLSKLPKTAILVATVAILSTGCRYKEEYKKISAAGNQYTIAVDTLLAKAGDLQIDATSERMLADDRGVGKMTLQKYEELKKQDQEILEVISGIREHNDLLGSYFAKLKELAHSDAPEQTQKEIEGIASNLQTISTRLQASSFFPNKSILGGIGKLVVNSKIDGVLREELEKRNQTILQELTVQQELLDNLKGIMEQRIGLIQRLREQRMLIRPITAPEPMADRETSSWIEERRRLFFLEKRVAELKKASDALDKFKIVYQAAVEGKINSALVDNTLNDINAFLALLNYK